MIDIKKQWENYIELGKQVIEKNISEEAFKKEINAFSSFLSEANRDYYYNATYLSNYAMEFLHFLEYFYRKIPLVKRLFEVTSSYPNLSLVIDRYWQQESVWDDEEKTTFVFYKAYPSYKEKMVCDDTLLIECSILCETKRYIYHSKIEIDEEKIKNESHNLKEFLNARTSQKIK